MRKMTKRSAVVASAVAVAVVGAGAAWAAWSLTGTGDTTAAAGKAAQLEVKGVSTTPLVPGATSDVTVTVTNPNQFPVLVKSINFSDFKSNKEKCEGNNIEQVTSAKFPAGTTVAPGGSAPITYAGSIRMIGGAADACQEAKFSFKTAVSAESAAS